MPHEAIVQAVAERAGAMLAFLAADSAEAILKRSTRRSFTEHTKTDLQQIRQEIKAARAQGFCVAVQEIYLGEISIAAPVFDMARQPVGALNIPLPQLRGRLGELPRDKEILVICRSAVRAHNATRILVQGGFKARNVSGGMLSRAMFQP